MSRIDVHKPQTIAGSAARAVSGETDIIEGLGPAETLRVQLDVTAFAGTSPTLNAVVEDTLDGVNWNAIGTFAQRVGNGREVLNITTPFTDRIRVRWTIGGTTPSFIFSVVMFAQ